MKIQLKIRNESVFNIFIVISSLLLLAPAFINFDAHHDGLVLSTVLELRKSVASGGQWPFNQYGQIWAFPFVLVSFIIPDQFLLIAIRLVTFFYYMASAFLIYRISRRFLNGTWTRIPVVLFLISEPFALGLNSTFLPWPSALCTLLILIVLDLLTGSNSSQRMQDYSRSFVGFFVVGILGTRLQVGLITFFSIGLLLFLHKEIRGLKFYLFGFSLSLFTLQIFMLSRGWLADSLYDAIIFSSKYLSGDASVYPFPIVTFLLSMFALVGLVAVQVIGNSSYSQRVYRRRYLFSGLIILFFAILGACFKSSIDTFSWFTLLIRRSWISISIAFLIYELASSLIRGLQEKSAFTPDKYKKNVLLSISICSFSQIFPLFDQMHFWWGFSPLVILIVQTLQRDFSYIDVVRTYFRPGFVVISTILIVINLLGVAIQTYSAKARMSSSIASGILVSDSTDNEISEFLNKHVPPRASILTLCPNSNAIFSLKSSKSAIREIVLWPPTFDLIKYRDDFLGAKYDFAIACPLSKTFDPAQLKINVAIDEVINSSKLLPIVSLTDAHNRKWTIYRIS